MGDVGHRDESTLARGRAPRCRVLRICAPEGRTDSFRDHGEAWARRCLEVRLDAWDLPQQSLEWLRDALLDLLGGRARLIRTKTSLIDTMICGSSSRGNLQIASAPSSTEATRSSGMSLV